MNENKYQVEVSEDCPEIVKIAIQKYWEIQNDAFINKPGMIAKSLDLATHEFSRIVNQYSKLHAETNCKNCDNTIQHTILSQTAFKHTLVTDHYCQSCLDIIKEEKRIKEENRRIEEEKERKKLIDRHTKAIEEERWKRLNRFEFKILYNIIHTYDFNVFLKKYKYKDNHFWAAIFKLRDLDLILLETSPYGNSIIGAQYLNQLKEELPEPESNHENTMQEDVELNKKTNELCFKLTKNPNPYGYDSPEYSGTLEFPQQVVLKPGIEYSFAAWKKQNDVLYLTIIPTEDKRKLPKQKNKAW